MKQDQYALLDSGDGQKLEAFGDVILCRPAAQAAWPKQQDKAFWAKADGIFSREEKMSWTSAKPLPSSWTIQVEGIYFKLSTTDFGHLGIFPEQKNQWNWIKNFLANRKKENSGNAPARLLNLFAYSGGVTIAAAKCGAEVCHLDASKGMVDWARENARLNQLEKAPIRWIVDDVKKFLKRELKRGNTYDAIVLDPPTFGRGSQGELFKIEKDLPEILELCSALLSSAPLFMLLSCHTPGFTPIVLQHLLDSALVKKKGGIIECAEMALTGEKEVYALPSGAFARWSHA